MMADGRSCCDFSDSGVPVEEGGGICVGGVRGALAAGQSKVSYHMRKLKDAGLVREERRGRAFYSLDRGGRRGAVSARPPPALAAEKRSVVGEC